MITPLPRPLARIVPGIRSQAAAARARRLWICAVALAICLSALSLLHPAPARAAQEPAPGDVTAVEKVTDPDTSASWHELFGTLGADGTYSTEQAGRIWVDKSVYASATDAAQAGITEPGTTEPDEFIVSLSALSSTSAVQQLDGRSHDVVFVVSVNGILADMNYAGLPYASYLASALNTSIKRLMDANEDGVSSRIAVVAYSAATTTVLPLGTYAPDSAGRYVAFDAATRTLQATATPVELAAGGTPASAALGSGSYLQRAIADAGDILVAAGTGAAPERTADMVIVGIETPPMANIDIAHPPVYAAEAPGFVGPLPHQRSTGYGTDALLTTLLTMRYQYRRINQAYEAAGGTCSIYTTGIDTTDAVAYLLQTPAGQNAMTLTATVDGATVDLIDNMRSAQAAYAAAAERDEHTVSVQLAASGTRGLTMSTLELPVVEGLVDPADTANLSSVDAYFAAHSASAIEWAAVSATDDMQGVRYTSPVSAASELEHAARVTARDELGAGMRVGSVRGIQYGDTLLSGALAAQAVQISLQNPGDLSGATHEFDYLVRSINERYHLGYDAYNLFNAALADGQIAYRQDGTFSHHASWYVDAYHNMVADGQTPYSFAPQTQVDAIEQGTWAQDPSVAPSIKVARKRGATAVCETYFFIGNFPNSYTGGDAALYDFYLMVETDIATGRQTVLASLPAAGIPALRSRVTIDTHGQATMALDGARTIAPVRLIYTVKPTDAVEEALDQVRQGVPLSFDALPDALAEVLVTDADGAPVIAAGTFVAGADATAAGARAGAIAAPTNGYYLFLESTPLYTLAPGAEVADGSMPQPQQLVPLTSAPVAGATYYYLETAYTARFDTADDTAPASTQQIVLPCVASDAGTAAYAPGASGQYEALPQTPTWTEPASNSNRDKDPNATATAPFVEELSQTQDADGNLSLSASLGNNGVIRLVTQPEEEPGGGTDPDPGDGGGTTDPAPGDGTTDPETPSDDAQPHRPGGTLPGDAITQVGDANAGLLQRAAICAIAGTGMILAAVWAGVRRASGERRP